MLIQGKWYKPGSAAQSDATLLYQDYQQGRITIETTAGEYRCVSTNEVRVSDRLGNVERKLTLADGAIFATSDNDSIDTIFKNTQRVNGWIHAIETNITWVAVALVVTIAAGFGFVRWGVPWASYHIAHALPHKTNELISINTMAFLDDYLFEQTELDTEERDRIRAHFESKLVPLEKITQKLPTLYISAIGQAFLMRSPSLLVKLF